MKIPVFVISAAALALASCAMAPPYAPAVAPTPVPVGTATITTANKAPFGTYLVDGAGRSLYVLEGTRTTSGVRACDIYCARIWPPVMVAGPPIAGAEVDPRRLGAGPRGGGRQLSYAGWPLFYYVRDSAPGQTTGQAVTDPWGTWYLLSPSGNPIRPY